MSSQLKLYQYLRNYFIGQSIVYLIFRPSDLEMFFFASGVFTLILCAFCIVNVVVDGKTVKIGKGFSSAGGEVNRLLIGKLLQSVFGTEYLYDRGHGMRFDLVSICMLLAGIINIIIYILIS